VDHLWRSQGVAIRFTLPGFPCACNSLRVGASGEIIEFATENTCDERRDLGPGVHERGARRMAGVAHRNVPTCEFGQLHAVAAGVAGRALPPDQLARLQMHVQMFTHQHLRMQGGIDTIVLQR